MTLKKVVRVFMALRSKLGSIHEHNELTVVLINLEKGVHMVEWYRPGFESMQLGC